MEVFITSISSLLPSYIYSTFTHFITSRYTQKE
jgi:hypothetical protein